jgi:hypothetical protein
MQKGKAIITDSVNQWLCKPEGVKRREGSCWQRKRYQLLETLCPQELRMTLGRFLACMHFLF